MELLEKEQTNCTFAPKINETERRTFEEFLESQQKHLEKKRRFKEENKRRTDEEQIRNTGVPEITQYQFSQEFKTNRETTDPYERLLKKTVMLNKTEDTTFASENQPSLPLIVKLYSF